MFHFINTLLRVLFFLFFILHTLYKTLNLSSFYQNNLYQKKKKKKERKLMKIKSTLEMKNKAERPTH